MRRCRNYFSGSRRTRATRRRTAISPHATPIWGGSTRREKSWSGCGRLPLSLVPDASYLRNAEDRELWLAGLRLAAGETT
jgi:hypothetical protein